MRSGDVLSALLYLLTGSNTTVGLVQVGHACSLVGVCTSEDHSNRCLIASACSRDADDCYQNHSSATNLL